MGLMRRFTVLLLTLLTLSACAPRPLWQMERQLEFSPPPGGSTVYISPFRAVLAPDEITDGIFDRFVDGFNLATPQSGLAGVILKTPPAEVDPAWLASRHQLTGEVFAYREDIGCCSTELRVGARVEFFQPGREQAVVRITVPYDILFDHERSNLAEEKVRLMQRVAERLKNGLLAELSP